MGSKHNQNIVTFDIAVPGFLVLTGYCFVTKKTIFENLFASSLIYLVVGIIMYEALYLATQYNSQNPLNLITQFEFLKDNYSTWWFLFVLLFLFLVCPLLNKLLTKYN